MFYFAFLLQRANILSLLVPITQDDLITMDMAVPLAIATSSQPKKRKKQLRTRNTPALPQEWHEKVSKNSKIDDEVVKEDITPTNSSRRQKQQCKFSKDHEAFNLLA